MIGLGAIVMVVSRSEEDVAETVKALADKFGEAKALGVACDVSKKEGREKLAREILQCWGAVSDLSFRVCLLFVVVLSC